MHIESQVHSAVLFRYSLSNHNCCTNIEYCVIPWLLFWKLSCCQPSSLCLFCHFWLGCCCGSSSYCSAASPEALLCWCSIFTPLSWRSANRWKALLGRTLSVCCYVSLMLAAEQNKVYFKKVDLKSSLSVPVQLTISVILVHFRLCARTCTCNCILALTLARNLHCLSCLSRMLLHLKMTTAQHMIYMHVYHTNYLCVFLEEESLRHQQISSKSVVKPGKRCESSSHL